MTPQEEYELGLAFYNGEGQEKNIGEAIKHFEFAANAGNLEAMNKLGAIYCQEENLINIELAIKWFSLASDGGLLKATSNLGKVYYYGPDGGGLDYNKALEYFNIAAEKNDVEALSMLGEMYYYGTGVEKDELKAFSYYLKASDLGDSISQLNVAMCYHDGTGVEKSIEKSIHYLQLALNTDGMAESQLGYMYITGDGVKKDPILGEQYLLKAIDLGNASACNNLAYLYFSGDGVERNYEKALKYYEKAVAMNDDYAKCWLRIGYQYEQGLGTPRDLKKAFECYKKAADADIPDGYNNLGACYKNGWGCEKDDVKALEYYHLAVEHGSGFAYANIGDFYYSGIGGVEQDIEKALEYYQKACDAGQGIGAFKIGTLYLYGRGVKQDFSKAFEYLSKSAELRYSMAMNNLGTMYENGTGVEQDYSKAFEWYVKANNAINNEIAQKNIADMYFNGRGVEKDLSKAAFWYQCADEKNYTNATYCLAKMFSSGNGVELNYNEAFRLFRKAALQGHAGAQVALGNAYCSGKGVRHDMGEAVFWWKKSCSLGRRESYFNISCAYIRGEGVVKNDSEAINWLQKAADIEDSTAQTLLGYAYFYGEGVSRDNNRAIDFFKQAKSAGSSLASCCLDNIEAGNPLPSRNAVLTYKTDYFSDSKIEEITEKAELGDTNAQSLIAHLSLTDDRFSHGTRKAAVWFKKAAKKGDAESLFNLAYLILGNTTITRENENPLELIKASADAGYPRAKFVMASIEKGKESEITEEKLLELCDSPSSIEDIVISTFGDTYSQSDIFVILFILYLTHRDVTLEQSREPEFISSRDDSILSILHSKVDTYIRLGSVRKKAEDLSQKINKIDRATFNAQYPDSLLRLIRRTSRYFSKPLTYPDSKITGLVAQEMRDASAESAICICASLELPVLIPNVKYFFRDTDQNKLLLNSIILDAHNISDSEFDYKEPFDDLVTTGFDTIICQTPLRNSPRAEYDVEDIQSSYIHQIASKKDRIKTAIVFVDSDFCSSTVASRYDVRKYLVDNCFLKKVIEIPKGTFGDVESNSAIIVLDFAGNHKSVQFVFDSDSLVIDNETISQMDYSWNYRIYNQEVDRKDGQVVLPLKQIVSFDFKGERVVDGFVQLTRDDLSSALLEALNCDESVLTTNSGDSTFWMKHKGPGVFFTYDGEIRAKRVADELYYSTGNLGYFLTVNDSIVDVDYVTYLLLHDYSLSRYLVEISDSRGRFNYSDFLNRKVAIYTDKGAQRQIVEKALIEERQGVITQTNYNIVLVSSETNSIVLQYADVLEKNHITVFRSADYVEESPEGNSYVYLRDLLLNKQSQTKVDAIVVDGEIKNSRKDEEYGLGLILEDYSTLKECGIPMYLFSEMPISRLGLRPGEKKDIVESGRFFSKNDETFFETMIRKIRDDSDKKDSPITRIRSDYKNVFEAADAIDLKYHLTISNAISSFILDGCKIDENPAASSCGPFRLAGHRLIEIMQSKNMVPKLDPGAIPHLLSDKYYYDNKSGKRYYQYSSLMPQYLSDALCYFFSATNAGVHGSQDSSLIGRSTLSILMEFILWFHKEFIVEAKYDFSIPDKYFWGVKDDYEPVRRDREYVVSCMDDGKEKYYFCENVHLKTTEGLHAGCKVRFISDRLGDDNKPRFDNGLRIVFYANEKQYNIVSEQ